jgi:hypothetical protein
MTEYRVGELVQWIAEARNVQTDKMEALLFQGQVVRLGADSAVIHVMRPYPCKPNSTTVPFSRLEKVSYA